ncbi:MAG: hypothetical protein M3300_14080, partial [Actinomycetota bacterium]|nr:hypothetical protein [Actinomycetota bacterium]
WATADATPCPPRSAIMAASSPGRRLPGYDRLGGLIHEYPQVATLRMTYSAPTGHSPILHPHPATRAVAD